MLPELRTRRLRLRSLGPADVEAVHRMLGDPDVSGTALGIPYPYERSAAEAWIASRTTAWAERRQAVFGAELAQEGKLCGAVGLTVEAAHGRAELGYWVGRPFWGHGLATEAAQAVVDWGFAALGLRRVWASHIGRNPASGRVLEKLGFRCEGRLREHVLHRGRIDDLVMYGRLASDQPVGIA